MSFLSGMTYQFKAVFHVDRNIIEVPSVYHKQWAPDYPNYVVFDYNGKKHHIRVRKFSNRVYIVDGLKHFRRDMRIYEGRINFFGRSLPESKLCGTRTRTTPHDYLCSECTSF
ncbi:hypothetical protein D0Y65_015191 [Glycine soja]|uniref:DUF7271 domain-containing protein n=1 Tax=Glycine soja TaxID=3848 RepID=A0A445KC23_GLYSO|nr:hypothetical protein D0Y65_015191 [Glycine soja]